MTGGNSDLATIVDARVVAGHDGSAELILVLLHGNGITGAVALDAASAFEVIAHCNAEHIEDLVGCSWRSILDGCGPSAGGGRTTRAQSG